MIEPMPEHMEQIGPLAAALLRAKDEEIKTLRAVLDDCVSQLETYGCDEQGHYMESVKRAIANARSA